MNTIGNFVEVYQKAAMWLALNRSLFAQMMYAVPNYVVSDASIPTAATTGKERYFSKEFMDSLPNDKQRVFVLMHEIMHDMLMHKPRMGNRDPDIWNIACDIKINNLLEQSGVEAPKGAILHLDGERFHGKSEEEIYDKLMEYSADIPDDYAPDLIGDELSPDEIASMKGKIQAAVEAHGVGDMPQELRKMIETAITPREKWYEILRRFFVSKVFSGCDWSSMCRREYARSGIVAPPFQSDSLGTVVISVDESGSITEETLADFAAHVNDIIMDCKPEKTIVQYFDTNVHLVEEYEVADLPITLVRACGGGTSFVDCCKKAEEYNAAVHVVLTDMCGTYPESSTVPTIWVDVEGSMYEPPFGEHLVIRE